MWHFFPHTVFLHFFSSFCGNSLFFLFSSSFLPSFFPLSHLHRFHFIFDRFFLLMASANIPGGGRGYYIRPRVGELSGLWTLQQWMGYTLDKSTWLVTWTGKRGQDSQNMTMFGKRIFLRKCLWKRINFFFNIFTKGFRIKIFSQKF